MVKKNILISSGHPAQVHNFRHLKKDLENKGYNVYWLATDKDISRQLLDYYEIDYSLFKKPSKGLISKGSTLAKNVLQSVKFIKQHNINFAVSRVSPYLSIASYMTGVKHLVLTDTETAEKYDKFFVRFASGILTATSFKNQLLKDQIRFKGNIELFYLHPNRFKASDEIYTYLKIEKGEPYVICRFVSWDAYHDKGLSGFTDEHKIKAVQEFSRFAKVYITSEKELPPELERYRILIPPEKMHDALAHATLFFGESATMASESAVLGKPAIFLDKHGRGYTDEEGEFGLVYNYTNSEADQIIAIEKGIELLRVDTLEKEMKQRHQRFMADKIDMTAFLVWFIENWPYSKYIMLENPEYQNRFK